MEPEEGEEGENQQPAVAIAGFRFLDRLDFRFLPVGGSAAHLSQLVSFCCCIPKPSQILLWWQWRRQDFTKLKFSILSDSEGLTGVFLPA